MPRLRKRAGVVPVELPISALEVEAMFRQALPAGPMPDTETCGLLATVLSEHAGLFSYEASRTPKATRINDAVVLLLQECERFCFEMDGAPGGVWWEWPAIQKLDAALREARHLLVPGKPPRCTAPWFSCAIIVSEGVRGILDELGITTAGHRNGPLAGVTASALQRMGFSGATARKVEAHLYKTQGW